MLMIGSVWTSRAPGETERTAPPPAIDARTSWRFRSSPRPVEKGLKNPASPPAYDRKEISLTGATIGGASVSSASSRANAPAKPSNRRTNSAEYTSRPSGHPKWSRSQITWTPASRAARTIGSTEDQSYRPSPRSTRCQRTPSRAVRIPAAARRR